jgi:alpha-beta hydrolase superfamily lysophospholipase
MDRLFSAGQLRELRTRGHTVRKGLAISASVVEAIRSKAAVEAAKSVAVPSTVLHGDRDELYPLEGAVELTQALCHGDLRVIEGGDHNFLDQASRDKLTREVLAALSLEHHATLL